MAVGAKHAMPALKQGLRCKIKVPEQQSVKNKKTGKPAMRAWVVFERLVNPAELLFVLVIAREWMQDINSFGARLPELRRYLVCYL